MLFSGCYASQSVHNARCGWYSWPI